MILKTRQHDTIGKKLTNFVGVCFTRRHEDNLAICINVRKRRYIRETITVHIAHTCKDHGIAVRRMARKHSSKRVWTTEEVRHRIEWVPVCACIQAKQAQVCTKLNSMITVTTKSEHLHIWDCALPFDPPITIQIHNMYFWRDGIQGRRITSI